MLQVIRSPKVYDVCIVGIGRGRGAAAKVLTEGGLSVVMLEAGPPLYPAKDFKEHLWPYDLPHRDGRQRNQNGKGYAADFPRHRRSRRRNLFHRGRDRWPSPYGLYDGGTAIHESGTVRMGDNPNRSALNKYCQTHEVTNLFVTDAAVFVTSPDKNPTLSILALSWRASEYRLEQAKKGNM